MKKLNLSLLFILATIGTAFANPITLNATVNVDNIFDAYISTSASTLGTLIGSDTSNWADHTIFSSLLTPGVTNYLHVVATNQSGPDGFLGEFTLSGGSGFVFDNGTQTLLTGDAGWTSNTIGFGHASTTTLIEGPNGSGPWGLLSGYGNATPDWIWNTVNAGTVYFSASIDAVTLVSEPASIALISLGLLGLFSLRKRLT